MPNWPGNPYQRLLASHLTAAGVDTACVGDLKSVVRNSLSNGSSASIVHHHWLSALGWSPTAVARAGLLLRRMRTLQRLGIPLVWTVHNVRPHEAKFPLLDLAFAASVARIADELIVHSAAAREQVIRAYRLSSSKPITVVPHGNYVGVYENTIDRTGARQQLGIQPDEFVFLFLGSIRPYKGVIEMIQAFRRAAINARLVIAGKPLDAAMDARVRREVQQTPGAMFIPGFVPDNEIQNYFNACDTVVFPYHRSLSSGALVLAMSFGKCCLVPDLDTITELVDGTGGFCYRPGDFGDLSHAMREAVVGRSSIEDKGRRNYSMTAQFGWPLVASRTIEVYRRAIATSTRNVVVSRNSP